MKTYKISYRHHGAGAIPKTIKISAINSEHAKRDFWRRFSTKNTKVISTRVEK